MKRYIWAAMAASMLVACGGGDENYPEAEIQAIKEAAPPPMALMSEGDGFQRRRESEPAPSDEPVQNPDGAQFIAYTYNMGLSLPQENVEPVMAGHVAACEAAGSRACIVINSSLNNQSDDYTSGYLSLRAVPSWIATFQTGVDAEVEAADGEVTNRNKNAVDLTRQILDVDARLKARVTLKGRLEVLLATQDGELGDLLQIERELARVTGEIESMSSNLKALRLRVSMSELSVNYETKRSLVSGGRTNPLASAFGDFFYDMAGALAAVVTFFAVGLPWMLLIALFLYIWLRAIWPRIRSRRAKS